MPDGGAANRRGELRTAIEGLLRTCVELERRAEAFGHEARGEVNNVAEQVVGMKLPDIPGMRGLADQIAAIGAQMEADVTATLGDGRRPYLEEVHELLGLLAPYHGVSVQLPPMNLTAVAVRNVDTFANQFPAGFARTYIRDLVASVDRSLTLTLDEAGRIHVLSDDEATAVKHAAGPGFGEAHRDTGVQLLENEACHAVEQHGPHIPDEAQLARLIWLKDFTGEYSWNVDADGNVGTTHWAGTTTGGFNSPEALAKPIDVFLTVAHRNHRSVDEFLDDKLEDEKVIIHVGRDEAGLEVGDASGFRGAGTGTKETLKDWKAARKLAMQTGQNPVHAVPNDPLGGGTQSGASLIFKKTRSDSVNESQWNLVSCFPVEKPTPGSTALEELS